jgi:hypothetical protein
MAMRGGLIRREHVEIWEHLIGDGELDRARDRGRCCLVGRGERDEFESMLGGALYRPESGGAGVASGKVSWKFSCREGVGLINLGATEGEALQGKARAFYLCHRATRPGGILQVFS